MFKQYFPIFKNNPELVYLDNAASTQKPQMVIDGVSDFLAHDYANIHRGLYDLSERSESLYDQSKHLVAELLNTSSKEVIYTYNATYAINLVAQSLVNSNFLQKGDKILVSIWDHHANSLPRLALGKLFGIQVEFFWLEENYEIDRSDFEKKYDDKIKLVACGHVSNVTGNIYDLKKIKSKLRKETFFLVDGSQSVPNFSIDFQDIGADALVFTAHKMMAQTWLWVLVLKNQRIKELEPLIVWGGTIKDVSIAGFDLQKNNQKFEAGTPNIVGAVSLLHALEFIKTLSPDHTLSWGMQAIWQHEHELVSYALKNFQQLWDAVQLIGSQTAPRVALFSFVLRDEQNFNRIWEFFAEQNICIRCGGHCAYPLHKHYHLGGTCRMSAYLYNTTEDLDRFFTRLSELIKQQR